MNSVTFKDDNWELEEEGLKKGTYLVFRVAIVWGTQAHFQGTGRLESEAYAMSRPFPPCMLRLYRGILCTSSAVLHCDLWGACYHNLFLGGERGLNGSTKFTALARKASWSQAQGRVQGLMSLLPCFSLFQKAEFLFFPSHGGRKPCQAG